jgi:hypothetical protein
MAGHSLIESEAREQPVRTRQPLLAMPTLLFCGSKDGRSGQVESVLCGDRHQQLPEIKHKL